MYKMMQTLAMLLPVLLLTALQSGLLSLFLTLRFRLAFQYFSATEGQMIQRNRAGGNNGLSVPSITLV